MALCNVVDNITEVGGKQVIRSKHHIQKSKSLQKKLKVKVTHESLSSISELCPVHLSHQDQL
jgi:hypothetical protein